MRRPATRPFHVAPQSFAEWACGAIAIAPSQWKLARFSFYLFSFFILWMQVCNRQYHSEITVFHPKTQEHGKLEILHSVDKITSRIASFISQTTSRKIAVHGWNPDFQNFLWKYGPWSEEFRTPFNFVGSQSVSEVRFRQKPRDNFIVWPETHNKVIVQFFHYILIC
jgi:hypothetical protein